MGVFPTDLLGTLVDTTCFFFESGVCPRDLDLGAFPSTLTTVRLRELFREPLAEASESSPLVESFTFLPILADADATRDGETCRLPNNDGLYGTLEGGGMPTPSLTSMDTSTRKGERVSGDSNGFSKPMEDRPDSTSSADWSSLEEPSTIDATA